MVEFTTGMGTGSGGHRRPHWNDVWKGLDVADAGELHERVSWAWCKRVDAEPRGQYVGAIAETGGLMRYLALHFQKESQQPPPGWSGQRFNVGRGYLAEPMPAARQRARQALRLDREVWRAERAGLTGADALAAAELALYEANELSWELVRLVEIPSDVVDGVPTGWTVLEQEVRP
jgi:CelD/BcsL family acetyltransferase involved in cellulose biosynthesis